jgi:hypothetical protein
VESLDSFSGVSNCSINLGSISKWVSLVSCFTPLPSLWLCHFVSVETAKVKPLTPFIPTASRGRLYMWTECACETCQDLPALVKLLDHFHILRFTIY